MRKSALHCGGVGMALAATLLIRAAHGDPLLTVNDDQGNLGTVDVGTGTVVVVGALGVTLTDIAFAPNGDLFGIDFGNLYRIDPKTAATAFVGNLGAGSSMNALVFSSDGVLFAAAFLNQGLYTINPNTGAATLVGNIGAFSSGDLAFDASGQLFMTSTTSALIKINRSTGTGTPVGPLGLSNVFGLAFGGNNVMYGYAGTTIFSINLETGAGTFVLDYGGHGLSSANGGSFITEAAPSPTPTLSPTTSPVPSGTLAATNTPTATSSPTPRSVGAPCTSNAQCTSTFCVDAVCCNAASCRTDQRCNIYGSSGMCDDPLPRGKGCHQNSDCASNNCEAGPPSRCGVALPTPTATPGCVGDCDGSGDVTAGDLLTLVNIALGNADALVCPNGIPSGVDTDVTLILQAVNAVLSGCCALSGTPPEACAPSPTPGAPPPNPLYVGVSGDDTHGGGNPADALRTISKAAQVARTGYTIFVGPGTYLDSVTLTSQGQAPDALTFLADITGSMTADPAGEVIINAAGTQAGKVFTNPRSDLGYDGDFNLVLPSLYLPPGIQGAHDLAANAQFVSPGTGNLQLRASSPAINHGGALNLPAATLNLLHTRTTTGVDVDGGPLDLGFHYSLGNQ